MSLNDLLVIKHISKIFRNRRGSTEIRALDDVTFSIKEGEKIAIIGESGSGKTTLAKILVGLVQPDEGEIIYQGRVIIDKNKKIDDKARKDFGIVFQDPYESLNPTKTVFDSISLPLRVRGIKNKELLKELVYNALMDVGLSPPEEFMRRYPHQLSGGQRQRVALARAIIYKPKVLIADEPTTMIDASLKSEIIKLLLNIKQKFNMTLITITHEFNIARIVADKLVIMYKGRIVEEGATSEILKSPKHPYTQALISSIPSLNSKLQLSFNSYNAITNSYDEKEINTGCKFYFRCPYKLEKCLNKDPPLFSTEKSKVRCFLYE
jgi:oligopeptide/dipeptide ABC transporter ATP-binding protein